MKINAIERFHLRNSLELTFTNPIGYLMVESAEAKKLFLESIGSNSSIPNIIYYNGTKTKEPLVMGSSIRHRCVKTVDVFFRVDELCKAQAVSGFKIPLLVIFDEIPQETIEHNQFQNDIIKLFLNCKHNDIKVLLLQKDCLNEFKWILEFAKSAIKRDAVNYKIIEHDSNYILYKNSDNVQIISPDVGFYKMSNNEFNTKLFIKESEEHPIDNFIELNSLLLLNEHIGIVKRNKVDLSKNVYVLKGDRKFFDFTQCDEFIRLSRGLCYSIILVGDEFPTHVLMMT